METSYFSILNQKIKINHKIRIKQHQKAQTLTHPGPGKLGAKSRCVPTMHLNYRLGERKNVHCVIFCFELNLLNKICRHMQ